MTVPLRSHASVRSYYFRERCAEITGNPDRYRLSDYRCIWRTADALAFEWRRRATTIWNPATEQWEQRS